MESEARVKTRRQTYTTFLLAVATCATVALSGCARGDKDVYAKPDEVICVYDLEDGKLIEQMAPGSKLTEVENDAEENVIVASNRFWNFTMSPSKDVASAGFIISRDKTQKKMQIQGEINMKFYVPNACEWNSNYGRRSFKAGYDGMAFNVEGDPNTPWQVWLKRNFEDLLGRVSESVVDDYTWKQLRYNWPTNADENGIVPDGVEVGEPVLREIEVRLSELFTAELGKALAGQYFCGPGYDPAKPDVCPLIQIQLTSIDLEDQAPAVEFEKLQAQREANTNATEAATLAEQSKDTNVRAEVARLAEQKEIKDAQSTAAIEDEKRKQLLLEAQQATAAAEAQQAANNELAVCAQAAVLNGGAIQPEDCARIILALKGLSPSVPGGTVNVGT